MKKFLYHSMVLVAAAIATCSTIVSCSTNELEAENNENNEIEVTKKQTLFSSGDNTRTSMDANRKFYWSEGDQIYVNTTGTTYQKTSSSTLAEDKRTASFLLEGVSLEEPTCSVMYIGNGTNTASTTTDDMEVTILNSQTQTEWDNGDHVGPSGDCGLDIATRNETTGKYTFKLNHKAAYLVFQPYKIADVTKKWTLMKIEIITDGTTNVAGTYPFGTGQLDVDNATNTSNTVTLTCGTAGFDLDFKPEPSASGKSCFAVIQPGTHTITIRYTIKPEVSVNNVEGATFTIEKTIASRAYNIGGVTTIKHELGVESYSTDLFYTWDAVNPYWYGVSLENVPQWFGVSCDDYATSADDERNRWYSTVSAPTQASSSCKDMPNVNAMAWYVTAGDPRWEKNYPWFFDGDGGAHVYTYGAWFLKWDEIPGKPENSTKTDCPKTHNGLDARSTALTVIDYTNQSSTYKTGGRPTSANIHRYFFLPALGHVDEGALESIHGCYWSMSPYPGDKTIAYYMTFSNSKVTVDKGRTGIGRREARVVAPDWFK